MRTTPIPAPPAPRSPPRSRTDRSWLDPAEVETVLDAYRIPRPQSRLAADPDEAAAAAAALGFPVALKIRSPDIIHKSDVGGIALGLGDAGAVRDAAAAMLARIGSAMPASAARRVPRAADGRDGRLPSSCSPGIADDPVFGPVILFGQGGTAVEIIDDSAVALPPLNLLLARAQMTRTRVWRLLQGYRDKPPAAVDAIADVLIRLGRLAAEHPEIRELDINPLLADPTGVIALDARIRVAPAPSGASASRDRALPERAGGHRRGCATAPKSICARSGPRTSRCCTISSPI